MVLVAQRDPGEAIELVDWDLLLFFASLFVVMRGLEATGAVGWIDRRALALAQGASPWRDATVVSAVMVALSNLISNVPAVILWRGTVPTLPDPAFVWLRSMRAAGLPTRSRKTSSSRFMNRGGMSSPTVSASNE